LIQERVGNTLELVGIGKNFLNETPAVQQLRDSIDKWDLIKLKSFCSSKEMVSKLKRTPTDWVSKSSHILKHPNSMALHFRILTGHVKF
jgi:hypothetical protein